MTAFNPHTYVIVLIITYTVLCDRSPNEVLGDEARRVTSNSVSHNGANWVIAVADNGTLRIQLEETKGIEGTRVVLVKREVDSDYDSPELPRTGRWLDDEKQFRVRQIVLRTNIYGGLLAVVQVIGKESQEFWYLDMRAFRSAKQAMIRATATCICVAPPDVEDEFPLCILHVQASHEKDGFFALMGRYSKQHLGGIENGFIATYACAAPECMRVGRFETNYPKFPIDDLFN